MPVNLPQRLINPEPNQKFLRGPLGMEGANAQGMGGGLGKDGPAIYPHLAGGHPLPSDGRGGMHRGGVGVQDACKLASLIAPHGREVRNCNQCDSEAAG